ncbi:MAG TPA: hypothetical protein P5556_03270 [Candidatus Gastranaerophilales bacterium]|nr:hypothetical protein [Candidatus Gastranaerophilales bacterium]
MKKLKKIFPLFLCSIVLSFSTFSFSMATSIKEDINKNNPTTKSFSEIPKSQQILTVLKTSLNVEKSLPGDSFNAEIMDNIFINDNIIIIPSGSMLSGEIIKVNKSGFIYKNSYIRISINKITDPSGKTTVLTPPFVTDIYAPDAKKIKDTIISKLPSSIISSGSSLVLGQTSSLAKYAVWGISTGAGMLTGVISGILKPDENAAMTQTCAKRAFDATPAVTLSMLTQKGKNFTLESGQFINIYFDKKTIKLMMKEFTDENKPISNLSLYLYIF